MSDCYMSRATMVKPREWLAFDVLEVVLHTRVAGRERDFVRF
jgi:hypothetical protein